MKRLLLGSILVFCATIYPFLSHSAVPKRQSAKVSTEFSGEQIQALELKLIEMINLERKKHGLSALPQWDVLSYYARVHSQNMASGKVDFGHDGFNDRAAAVRKYAQLTNFGENVAYCFHVDDPLEVSVDGWMESPGHRQNILDNFKETGVGIAFSKEGRCYLTQLFASRRTKSTN